MKTISLFLVSCFTVVSLCAQTGNTVTINLNSNRYQEVLVDGRSYPITNMSTNDASGMNGVVTVTDLQPGQHTLEVVRANQNTTNNRRNNSREFNLRARYDLTITVNNDGSVALNETRNRNYGNASRNRNANAMSDGDFSVLLQNIQSQRRASAKTTAVTNAFQTSSYYFTTDQAAQLLELVPSESKRLTLAESVYPKITDRSNFTTMYDLFDNQANRDALAAYVNSYNANYPTYNNNGTHRNRYTTAMTDADFNTLMKNVKRQWFPGAKMTAVANAFNNTDNYFTTSQASQLIRLVNDEDKRLQLAKSAYARITDSGNFSQLYELFSSQARRDELRNYVNSYSYNNR